MKKQRNTEAISNELSGASLFFQGVPDASGKAVSGTSPAEQQPQTARPAGPPPVRTPVRRRLTRMPFEFYQDQLDRLRTRSLTAKLRGERGSMSAMVREAVDRYLAEQEDAPTG